jgi:hypothetical protein
MFNTEINDVLCTGPGREHNHRTRNITRFGNETRFIQCFNTVALKRQLSFAPFVVTINHVRMLMWLNLLKP